MTREVGKVFDAAHALMRRRALERIAEIGELDEGRSAFELVDAAYLLAHDPNNQADLVEQLRRAEAHQRAYRDMFIQALDVPARSAAHQEFRRKAGLVGRPRKNLVGDCARAVLFARALSEVVRQTPGKQAARLMELHADIGLEDPDIEFAHAVREVADDAIRDVASRWEDGSAFQRFITELKDEAYTEGGVEGAWSVAQLRGIAAPKSLVMLDDNKALHRKTTASREIGAMYVPPSVPKVKTASEAHVAWRSLLKGVSAQTATNRAGSVLLTVGASSDALKELLDAGGEPVLYRFRAADERAPNVSCDGMPWRREYNNDILLAVRQSWRTSAGVLVECRATMRIGKVSRARSRRGFLDDATSSGSPGSLPDWLDVENATVILDDSWNGEAFIRRSQKLEPSRVETFEKATRDAVCSHDRAAWRAAGLPMLGGGLPARYEDCDTEQLRCDRCMTVLAAVPAHRLPDGNPLLASIRENERDYLDRDHAHAVLRGQRWQEASSIDELRARDGVASRNIEDYVSAPELKHGGRPQRVAGSIRGALTRR